MDRLTAAHPHPRGAHSLPRGSRTHTNGHGQADSCPPPPSGRSLATSRIMHTHKRAWQADSCPPPPSGRSLAASRLTHTHKRAWQADSCPPPSGHPPNPSTANSTRGTAGRGSDSSPTPCRNAGTVTRTPLARSGAQGRPTPSGPHPPRYQSGIAPESLIGSAWWRPRCSRSTTFTHDEKKALKSTYAREKKLITSGKSDPRLAQELEKEHTRLIEKAGKRGPSQAQDEWPHAHTRQEWCPLTQEV